MATNTYDVGDVVRVSAAYALTQTGAAFDPASVALSVKNAAGTVLSSPPAVNHDGLGLYHADVPIPLAGASIGQWFYRFDAPGAGQEGTFFVRMSRFYP